MVRPRTRAIRRAAAAAFTLAAAAATLLVALGPGGHAAKPQATLALAAPAGPAVTIGRHPVGLSVEYPLLAHDLGDGSCPPPELVRAIKGLGSPVLRIGGDSQDQVAPAGTPVRAGLTDLPADFWKQVACLERETRIPIVVGLNLAWGTPSWAVEMAAGARSAIPRRRLRFELGNEPDIYGDPVKWWDGSALVATRMPLPTYLARAKALEAVLGPRAGVEGPDFASGRWTASVPALARALRLDTIDAHYYPLEGCGGQTAASGAALLTRQIQGKLDERVRLARDARAAGLRAVISEANSVSCGGAGGVSDQPVSAVWALRMIVTALRDGFAAVRFHASGSAYDPFIVTGGEVALRPLYTGLAGAARLLAAGAKLQAIPNARALDGVEITGPGARRAFVLSNYTTRPVWVSLATRTRARILELTPGTPTTRNATGIAGAGATGIAGANATGTAGAQDATAATGGGARNATVAAVRGRARVQLPANSVVAITLAPAG